ncbi:hypothetical protein TVAG_360930 [Trichomonas vaginalis G3]|uniref:Uncharacterized protein n=1 Tax=Trichomonas vaginalis (strain ATCC PRA-98 / G3) TaxID=412133 RepID=A2FGQ0_TRIV3|nr:hypothetical protein TVAG_360930 [Trichomonas vaginalis G3]|eukprot:XP_001308862.1 hypothetical protein [Trichomonas vaginalis G3]
MYPNQIAGRCAHDLPPAYLVSIALIAVTFDPVGAVSTALSLYTSPSYLGTFSSAGSVSVVIMHSPST